MHAPKFGIEIQGGRYESLSVHSAPGFTPRPVSGSGGKTAMAGANPQVDEVDPAKAPAEMQML
jgi:hypothetical protein